MGRLWSPYDAFSTIWQFRYPIDALGTHLRKIMGRLLDPFDGFGNLMTLSGPLLTLSEPLWQKMVRFWNRFDGFGTLLTVSGPGTLSGSPLTLFLDKIKCEFYLVGYGWGSELFFERLIRIRILLTVGSEIGDANLIYKYFLRYQCRKHNEKIH